MEHVPRPNADAPDTRTTRGGGPPRETRPDAVRLAGPAVAGMLAIALSIGGARRAGIRCRCSRAGGRRTASAAIAAAPLTNLAHLDFLLDEATPPADVAGHTTYRLAEEPTLDPAVDVRGCAAGRHVPARRRRTPRHRDRHVGSGRVQRRRHRAGGRGLPAALGADRRRDQPRQRVRAAALAHVPADDRGPERGQRRAVDAARRHA